MYIILECLWDSKKARITDYYEQGENAIENERGKEGTDPTGFYWPEKGVWSHILHKKMKAIGRSVFVCLDFLFTCSFAF